tara:strand:+ start:1524 stop:2288 length:765 start_codon:yes stop_codon:yes gene_type:complete
MGKPHKKKLTPTYNGIVAAYEYAGMQRDVPGMGSLWADSAVGTRPNGKAAGALLDNWTGVAVTMVSPSALPPAFNGVADVVGTGQAFDPSTFTMLAVAYQEYGSFPVPMEIDKGAVECWVRAIDTAGTQMAAAYHYLLGIGTHSGNFKYIYFDAAASPFLQWVDSGVAVDTNWHHLLLNFDYGGTADYWIDGVKRVAAGGCAPVFAASRSWYIGDYYYSNVPFEGLIDTVRMYNRNLTDDEIIRNYWSGIGLHT